ncbi:MAG TPA: 4Fe-4S dicluster domain-containing protein [Vicinamibacterales bacterium]
MQGPQTDSSSPLSTLILDRGGLQQMLDALRARGYEVHGPTALGTAVNLAPITSVDDLPQGWISDQEPGRYRLERSRNGALFAYGPAVDSLKRYLNPPVSTIWRAIRENGDLKFEPAPEPPAPRAVIGVRPCDLHALARYDEVFAGGPYADPAYARRRCALFVVAVNCTRPGGTCFCASMGSGPRAAALFDIALTELPAADGEPKTAHRYLATAGSAQGTSVLAALNGAAATDGDLDRERALLEHAAKHMGRTVQLEGLAAALANAAEHAEWDEVAHRCLSCANCTMVCPTCFCSTVEDHSNLAGTDVERRRRWDSCFTTEFSYIHGGSTRPSVRARYRQWATHKFQHWFEQFGSHGCVGCGRCITWCPVGIDLTVELKTVAGART